MSKDTVELLKECSAGITMGTNSINDVIDYVKDENMRQTLARYKDRHYKLEEKARNLLHENGSRTEQPPLAAKGMAWIKTNMKLSADPSDKTCAGLITDGCDMGVKSLHQYLNRYKGADQSARELANDVIRLEQSLSEDMSPYL